MTPKICTVLTSMWESAEGSHRASGSEQKNQNPQEFTVKCSRPIREQQLKLRGVLPHPILGEWRIYGKY